MFFILSKLLWIAAAPTNLLLGVAAIGVAAAWRGARRGIGVATAALGALILVAVLPVGALLLRTLEDRFPEPRLEDAPPPDGIIVLGGGIDQEIGAARGQVVLVEGGSRLTAAAMLARRYPAARLVYTGGSNALVAQAGDEAADARRLWIDLGLAADRITVENRSRNTDENARFTRDVLAPRPGQRWLLVTSAYHMPRSVGLFRAAGFAVVPYPVDYRTTGGWRDLIPAMQASVGLKAFDLATREWVGLGAYWLSGKIASPFPDP